MTWRYCSGTPWPPSSMTRRWVKATTKELLLSTRPSRRLMEKLLSSASSGQVSGCMALEDRLDPVRRWMKTMMCREVVRTSERTPSKTRRRHAASFWRWISTGSSSIILVWRRALLLDGDDRVEARALAEEVVDMFEDRRRAAALSPVSSIWRVRSSLIHSEKWSPKRLSISSCPSSSLSSCGRSWQTRAAQPSMESGRDWSSSRRFRELPNLVGLIEGSTSPRRICDSSVQGESFKVD
mmetsp:Transcript_12675/g.36711  ORF Transcript_12675/g.36711 Transcript_12675/m.36711 type:complete len:239 (-) Transcript_12675:828-1544(-)